MRTGTGREFGGGLYHLAGFDANSNSTRPQGTRMNVPASSQSIELLEFAPVLKRMRWGGRRLETVLGKPLGEGNDYAESWEVSCHPDGLSVIRGGPFDGRTLRSVVREQPEAVLGRRRNGDEFPLLIKLLDANDRLSVQVHPNDEQAAALHAGENGKTEAWVILESQPESLLFAGLKPAIDRERFRQSIEDGTVADCLHSFPVSPGDCVFVPAGTVHAIGEGILLAEVQQSSNLTFRIHDWGRLGTDGQPRPLHVDEALACIDFTRGPVDPVSPRVISESEPRTELLVSCPYFEMRRHTATTTFELPPRDSFRVLMVLHGAAEIIAGDDRRRLVTGRTVLSPACCGAVRVVPEGDAGVVVLDVASGVFHSG
jgi:mannose-6-phosphate isomerase